MSNELWNGTCRGENAGTIVEFLQEYGPVAVHDLTKKLNRSTAYVCSLVKEFDALHFTREDGLKRDYVVWYDENCI